MISRVASNSWNVLISLCVCIHVVVKYVMACSLEMYNSDHHKRVSPRISFSSDFVDIQQSLKQEIRSPPPVSSDFEFSVSNYSMMTADQLFFEGRLLPFKDNRTTTTLRQELLIEEGEENDVVSQRPSKGRWKGFLGLKKSHNNNAASKKTETGYSSVAQGKRPFTTTSSSSQGLQDEGGSS